MKKNKRGLGADTVKKAIEKSKCADKHSDDNENDKVRIYCIWDGLE